MTRMPTLCVLGGTLAMLFAAGAARAETLTVHTTTVKPNIHFGTGGGTGKFGSGGGTSKVTQMRKAGGSQQEWDSASPTLFGSGGGTGKQPYEIEDYNTHAGSKIYPLNPQPLPP